MSSAFAPVNRPGLPKKPYTPEKPKGAKAMTAVIGFPYKDGIMVCADSQLTYPNGTKYTDHKVFAGGINSFPCLFAFADQGGLATEVRKKIFKEITKNNQDANGAITTEEVSKIVETVMDNQGRLYVDVPLQFILAIWPKNEEPSIIHFDGKSVNIKQDEVIMIGSGHEPLARYLIDHLFSFDMDWHHALAFGFYIVRQAIRYTNLCGEPMEGMFLDSKGEQEINERDGSWAEVIVLQQESRLDKWMFKQI
jgi:20S proteasome alpha/beta subunit